MPTDAERAAAREIVSYLGLHETDEEMEPFFAILAHHRNERVNELERENAELQRWNQTQRDRIAELRRQLEIVEASNDRMAKYLEYGDDER